ncbi:MAG: Crp/Fnr family transcriptional regulator, partial [Gammaproteobacteria bacterium]|nr:Crp/Fnr family transcriptional regulator [Gammaproteobacteria bacterium]
MNADARDYDIVGIISRSPWFEGLPANAHERLAEAARIRSYRKNSYLYTVGESVSDVYCILSGRIRLLLSSALGQEYAMTDLQSEEWLGEQFLAIERPTLIDARINEAATVLVIPRSVVLAVGEQHPQMFKKLFFHNILRSQGIYVLLLGMAFYPLRSRLAGRFLYLIEEHGQQEDEG